MKTKIFSVLVLISVSILLTGCAPKNNGNTKSTTSNTTQEETLKGNLLDLVKGGKNIKCIFSVNDASGQSSGITYVSEGKSRSDFSATSTTGETYESHSITEGDWIYTWTSLTDQGTKMQISQLPKSEETATTNKSVETFSNNMDYKCTPWMADGTKFNIPTNITFLDFTEMMKNIQSQTDKLKEGLKGMCGTCEMAGDAVKIAECKKNLGCE